MVLDGHFGPPYTGWKCFLKTSNQEVAGSSPAEEPEIVPLAPGKSYDDLANDINNHWSKPNEQVPASPNALFDDAGRQFMQALPPGNDRGDQERG